MKKTISSLAMLSLALAITSCASPGKRTAIGAGGGAAAGAVVGGLAGGWKGALIGGGVGAVAGGSIGNYLDKQAQELEKVAETKRTENGVLVKLKNDVLFDTNSAIVKVEAEDDLKKMGDILAKYTDDRIKIEGHTDSTGKAAYNEQLSVRRAEAVKAVLASRGVKETQILVHGYGATKPVADNKTAEGKRANRRVELHIDVPNAT